MHPGSQLNEEQKKWNAFVASLTKQAGLPSSALVRLTFLTSEETKYEITNYKELNRISKKFGNVTQDYITSTILIEVLALNFDQFGRRFSYEYNAFIEKNKSQEMNKETVSTFKLPALTITTAIIRQKRHQKKLHQKSESSSIVIKNRNVNGNNIAVDSQQNIPNAVTDEPLEDGPQDIGKDGVQNVDMIPDEDEKEKQPEQAEKPGPGEKKQEVPQAHAQIEVKNDDVAAKPKEEGSSPRVLSVVCIIYYFYFIMISKSHTYTVIHVCKNITREIDGRLDHKLRYIRIHRRNGLKVQLIVFLMMMKVNG